MIEPWHIVAAGIIGLIFLPIVAVVFVITGPPPLRRLAGTVLAFEFLAYILLMLGCIWAGLFASLKGGERDVLFILVLPLAFFARLWWGLWRASRQTVA